MQSLSWSPVLSIFSICPLAGVFSNLIVTVGSRNSRRGHVYNKSGESYHLPCHCWVSVNETISLTRTVSYDLMMANYSALDPSFMHYKHIDRRWHSEPRIYIWPFLAFVYSLCTRNGNCAHSGHIHSLRESTPPQLHWSLIQYYLTLLSDQGWLAWRKEFD